ncbi:DinB family protein [Paracoccus onubensis]|uniref:Damage-inducible protein DinB n=1 Tax=Paracoccus onubensis TaxID=1675788 RepID=A0A418T4K1_9RHOB|nr:DinB family protein [Paracoccus onubensis]RJE88148.1 damage-inducible protein DinB [Paracoccus onubensis]
MPNQDYVLIMARYNRWQNENLLAATDGLSPDERRKDRGAFFGSIERTFSHILWADMIWLHRFAGTSRPKGSHSESDALIGDWDEFRELRDRLDRQILQWAHDVSPDWFEGNLRWTSGMVHREFSMPRKIVIMHLFNHQTHHRGQIHAMLTLAGAQPGATDLLVMPEIYASA